jgi:putative membrane protein
MMDGINHSWGMGFGWGWIIGLVALVVIIWLVVKVVNRNKNPK